MRYNRLGNTGLLVSELCLGAMTFGGGGVWDAIGQLGQPEVDRLVGRALEAGINFFDTANVYSMGESEKLLGQALRERRHEVIIASKVRSRVGSSPNSVGLSRGHIMQEVDSSLKRLQTDYIDLYQIHGYDALTPLEETLRALDDVVKAGKVRYIGCSNLSAWQMMKAVGLSQLHDWVRFETDQAYYSLAGRELEREVVPFLEDQKLGLLVWSPLAGGFLSGKYRRNQEGPADSRRTNFDFPPVNREKTYTIVDVLDEIGKAHDASVARVALAWLLHQPVVTSVIIGAKKPEQLDDNIEATNLKLSQDELKRINAVSAVQPEYPGWMIAWQSGDRLPQA
ncbi:MAG TPA: aldo/keto reductase [Chloroflexia bacterium]|nr:aldo/keto reductase [Chloroflexia bacterium]